MEPTAAISEDAIKRAVLPFLRHFYRYRYEYLPGTDRAQFDAAAAGNAQIRADVLLTFEKNKDQKLLDPDAAIAQKLGDGLLEKAETEQFVCAVEATSADKLGEVRFELNRPYFLWDAAMWAAIALAGLFVFLFSARGRWLIELGWQGIAGLILAVGGGLFWAFFFALRRHSKYRYIYAVEQFKKYRADEQWVALAVDVFAENDREGYEELRKQLISNGFGLISVENDGSCQAVISPSRLGAFGEGRRFYDFIPAAVAVEKGLEKGLSKIPDRPVAAVSGMAKKGWQAARLDRAADPMGRFMRSFFYQKAVFGFGLLIVGLLAWRSRGFRSVEFFSEKRVIASRDTFRHAAEDLEYLEGDDVFFAERPASYLPPEAMADAGFDGLETVAEVDSDFLENIREAAGAKPFSNQKQAEKSEKAQSQKSQTPRVVRAGGDNCDRFSARKGWLVQDNFFSQKAFADERLRALRHHGLNCAAVRRSCFETGRDGWVVFLGGIFRDEKTARAEAQNFQKAEDRYSLLKAKLLVKKLR